MLISKKKEEFSLRIRKEERQKIFEKIRLQMLSSFHSNTISATFNGQRQIQQSIRQHYNHQQPLNFQSINQYVCGFKGLFTDQFTEDLITVVFKKFNKNGSALASVANLLSKTQQCQAINNMDIKTTLSAILQANTNIQQGEMSNSKVISYLLYQLVRVFPEKTMLQQITPYYPLIIKENEYFELTVLLLLSQASKHRILLPQKQIIEVYLSKQFYYNTVSQAIVYKLYELLDNYLRYDQTTELYQHYCNWIELRLKERAFPLCLKPDLIKMVTTIINSLDSNSPFVEYITKLSILKEIIHLGRYGTLQCKVACLELVTVLVSISTAQLLNYYVQNQLILEVMVYSLDLKLQAELTFKLLTSIALIIDSNRNYAIRAHQLGLAFIVERFLDCKYKKIIVEGAVLVQEILSKTLG